MKEWADYFPYVGKDELRANYHRQLDALQGKRNTYMVRRTSSVAACSRSLLTHGSTGGRDIQSAARVRMRRLGEVPHPQALSPRGRHARRKPAAGERRETVHPSAAQTSTAACSDLMRGSQGVGGGIVAGWGYGLALCGMRVAASWRPSG